METAVTQSASLVAQLQYSRNVSQWSASVYDGEEQVATTTITDSFELSIEVDAAFVRRVLRDALEDSLNKALADAGIDSDAASLLAAGEDFSPESTASRIAEFSVGFYAQYQHARAVKDGNEGLGSFVDLIKKAVVEGFASARTILEGFQEMDEQLWANLERTQKLTMEGIDAFADSQAAAAATAADGPIL